MSELTKAQEITIAALEKKRFHVNRVTSFEGEVAPTVFMSCRVNHYSTRYAEVGPDASVNGNADINAEIEALLS